MEKVQKLFIGVSSIPKDFIDRYTSNTAINSTNMNTNIKLQRKILSNIKIQNYKNPPQILRFATRNF